MRFITMSDCQLCVMVGGGGGLNRAKDENESLEEN